MEVRVARAGDREVLHALYREFAGSPPPWVESAEEGSLAGIDRAIDEGTAAVTEKDGEAIGFAAALRRGPVAAELTELYVRPGARRSGVATELVRTVLEAVRVEHVHVAVGVDNAAARAFYRRMGFQTERMILRLDSPASVSGDGATVGSVHLQTDDQAAVERAVARFVPRVSASRETVVAAPRNGWVAVYDEVANRDPAELRQLGRELSNVTGAVVVAVGVEQEQVVRYIAYEGGRIVDEYLSVPDFHGPIPPGDAIGLRANPTVMARLTGADPAEVRRVARIAASPGELPPARELAAELGRVLGITGAELGFDDARNLEGAILVQHR